MHQLSENQSRVLAIDPACRGFGYAVLEGPNYLLDYGMADNRRNKNAASLREIVRLIDYWQPDVLAIEDYTAKGSRRGIRVQDLLLRIRRLASTKRLKAIGLSRLRLRDAFAVEDAHTKHQIATAIAGRLPELAQWLPPQRKCWMTEDYRMPIFDAVALAITLFHVRAGRSSLRTASAGILTGSPRGACASG
jgi:Holliday junction resolvasome RuvABC endonuclease subunit